MLGLYPVYALNPTDLTIITVDSIVNTTLDMGDGNRIDIIEKVVSAKQVKGLQT